MITTDHTLYMIAAAKLLAQYVSAANRAGFDRNQVNAALAQICAQSVITEFWVSDENGEVEYSSADPQGFRFPLDPSAGTQAAPFAALLTGKTTIVVQTPQPRELDSRVFQYVGVAGADKPRIVQVGVEIEYGKSSG
ncbi:MAG: hypothetical protein F4234_06520 [Gammaproteobacteria bacterium]|nr:hypothetical protein [Gammaproteobacteria bacterium]MDE0509293.1 hypothetical protein [Gammaproteobacteria bacterium]MXX07060.1 hypothetical protein [Gammaproteobacteria bacterium]MXY91507.1 hypothetical protein [Gammaproteobacteria bacterium]MYA68123.1 hypothetical protein [Gammaproteobacteria bacterium]